jgi:histidyl-tRNA synthetase
MAERMEPVPGTADIWEPELSSWRLLEEGARSVFARYGYSEVRTPVFERTELFVRGIGGETDVVQKEMYTFADRGGRSLTLRPEGTAGVMRAMAGQGLAEGEERRVFYLGPMFRGERPAAGRRRQFHQVGVEAVGRASPALDAECIAMLLHYLEELGIRDSRLLLNSRGTAADRPAVSAALRAWFTPRIEGMCEDCRRRLAGNVHRILDCKADVCQASIDGAPRMTDLLGAESRAFFAAVCARLEALGIPCEVAPRLVRGLDYYEHTVFEVTHAGLGAQNALAGGGRYAITLPGLERPVEGVGWAAGMERLLLARESLGLGAAPRPAADLYVAALGAEALGAGLVLAQALRRHGWRVLAETGERSLKAQLRAANRCGARLALIRGDDELRAATVLVKDLVNPGQEAVALTQLDTHLAARLGPAAGT